MDESEGTGGGASARARDAGFYRDILELAGVGVIVADPGGRVVEVDGRLFAALGLDGGAIPEGLLARAIGDRELRLPGPGGREIVLEVSAKRAPDGSFRAVFRDVTETRRAAAELRLKTMFLEAVANSSADGILVVDPQGRKVLQNRKTIELWKIPREIEEDEDGDRQVAHVVASTKDPRLFLEEIEFQKRNPMAVTDDQLELVDGTVLDRHSAPVLGSDGEVYGRIYTFHDVTGFRRAEERIQGLLDEKEMILREVHHRVKNYMGTLQSILSLHARTLTEPSAIDALDDALQRVQGMVVLYDKLYARPDFESRVVSVYMRELVDEIVANFPRAAELTVERRFDDFVLDAKTMGTLGMIVNELLTNTMKYAFEGRTSGRIAVSVSLREGRARLAVEDDGVGRLEPEIPGGGPGFGLMLVDALVKQLEGTMRVVGGGGTRYEIEFRAEGRGEP